MMSTRKGSNLDFEDCKDTQRPMLAMVTHCTTPRAALHHPDKVGAAENFKETSDAFFRQLKLAQDTLMNPVQRFAYERFGPDMLSWQHCSSIRDYLIGGIQAYSPMYIGSAIFLVLLGVTGYLQWGRFVSLACG